MSGLDDLLGGLLGGKGGSKDLGGVLGGLGGGSGGPGGGSGTLGALLPILGSMLAQGGLSKVLSGFKGQGLGSQADSWVGSGSNEPVSGSQVRQALGDDEIAGIAGKLGVSQDEAAEAVAEVLPRLVDGVSPEGKLPAEKDLDDTFGRLAQSASGG